MRMPDGRACYVDGVVRSASNDVRNVTVITLTDASDESDDVRQSLASDKDHQLYDDQRASTVRRITRTRVHGGYF